MLPLLALSRLLVAYALGFFLPGYLAARALRARSPWAYALPLSWVLLTLVTLTLDQLGLPLRFGAVAAALLSACALLLWIGRRATAPVEGPGATEEAHAGDRAPPEWLPALAIGIALVGALAALRATLAPLAGYDTQFRWEFLARQVLRFETLSFYPPARPEDFRVYFHLDGFPPLVSVGYWWLYAAAGAPLREATAPLVLAQWGMGIYLAGDAARALHSRRAGWYAAALLAATPLYFRAVMIGQETGMTALSVAATLHALVRSQGPADLRAPALAGLAAAAGALSREYGLLLAAFGGAALLWNGLGRRAFFAFAIALALPLLPWFLRDAIRTGNPLASLTAGIHGANPVFAGLLSYYQTVFGLSAIGGEAAAWYARLLLPEIGGAALVGVVGAIAVAQRRGFLLAGILLVCAIFIASIGYTSGGLHYAARVLSPAAVLLAVAGGMLLARGASTRARGRVIAVILAAASSLAAVWSGFHPYDPIRSKWSDWPKAATSRTSPDLPPDLLGPIPRLLAPGTRLLTENAFAHAWAADHGVPLDLVPVWSPEVLFLFDPAISAEDAHARLVALGIEAILYSANVNADFLIRSSRFYAHAVRKWRIVASKDQFLLLLPPWP